MFCEKPRILIRNSSGKLVKPLTKIEQVIYEVKFLDVLYTPQNESNKPASMHNVVRVPCGHCIFCRAEQRREWSLRCWLEAKEYDYNQFITLTYDSKHDPQYGVDRSEVSRFMHTLREYFRRERKHSGIRFYACGDYGETTHRAHYHILLFNCPPFGDEKKYKITEKKHTLYKSKILERLWGKGGCITATVNRQVCDYVARYKLKSFNTKLPKRLHRSFQCMSTQKGIGLNYLLRNFEDIVANDGIRVNGNIMEKLPHYYDRKIAEIIGLERFREEIAKPRAEKAKAFIKTEMVRTGLSEQELYKRYMEQEREKITKSCKENE